MKTNMLVSAVIIILPALAFGMSQTKHKTARLLTIVRIEHNRVRLMLLKALL